MNPKTVSKKLQKHFRKQLKTATKPSNRLPLAIFFAITLLFFALRLNNFNSLMTFHSDQALFMWDVKEMVDARKIRLIGPIISTRIVNGISYFNGPHFYYILAALGVIFNWNVVLITKSLVFLLWWPSALILTYLVYKKFNTETALLSYFAMATSPLLIKYSHMILNPNFLALFSIGFFYYLYQSYRKSTNLTWFWTGVFAGICISFHFSTLLFLGFMAVLGIYKFIRKQATILMGLLTTLGVLVGNLPYFIFELRHSFYNFHTMFFVSGINPQETSLYATYTNFAFLPVIVFAFAFVIHQLHKRFGLHTAIAATLICLGYLYLTNPHSYVRGIGMPKGWSVPLQQDLADYVCEDQSQNPSKFEIAAMVTSDLRAMDWRWFLEKCANPEGFTAYPLVDTLYLVDQGFLVDGDPPGNWEVVSLEPYEIAHQEQLNEYLWFYKLVRIKEE